MFNFFKKFQKQEIPHQNQNHFVNSDNSKSFMAQSLDRLPEIHLRQRIAAPRLQQGPRPQLPKTRGLPPPIPGRPKTRGPILPHPKKVNIR